MKIFLIIYSLWIVGMCIYSIKIFKDNKNKRRPTRHESDDWRAT